MKPVAWLILIGDAIHNFADGMIIGVAFRKGIYGGIKTSIAIMCHEIPHEVGDFVVLIDSGSFGNIRRFHTDNILTLGLSIRRAMILNVVGSFTAYLGFTIGAALSEVIEWDKWVFAAAAGIFLYVAWIDMVRNASKSLNKSLSSPATPPERVRQRQGSLVDKVGIAEHWIYARRHHNLPHRLL